ncbi:MAG: (2Fe-2S)-binding protein, partial [Desulfohalobiaceae bacterium]|nr:(2Fe-2S)-binding protein [Desulfohalobiaceae bacterium]
MDATLLLNGRETKFTPGQTILDVARENLVHIPTLCYLERTYPLAACRICVVELQDSDLLVPACATAANEGMDIRTDSKRVRAARAEVLKMLVSRGYHDCPVCDAGGECGLQDLVHEYGLENIPMTTPPQGPPPEYATSFIRYWPERCILCYRCVAACRDVKHIRAIDI